MAEQYCETPTRNNFVCQVKHTFSPVVYLSSNVTWYMALTIPCKRFFFFVEVSSGSRLEREIYNKV
jgi:hypothetical protein